MIVDIQKVEEEVGSGDPPVAFTFRRPDEILAMEFDDSDDIMGERILSRGGRLAILGQGGIGKSFMALQMIAATITGRNFLGFQTHGADLRWLVFQAENSNRRLQKDMQRLKAWLGDDDWARVCPRLDIHTLETEPDFWLHIATDNAAFSRACEAVKSYRPDGLLFDPLKDLSIGDLNKDVDMQAVCSAMSAISRADGNTERLLVVLQHALTGSQGVDRAVGLDRASYGRNSKVLHAWSRAVINVAPVGDDPYQLVVSCGKNNNGPEFPTFAVRRNPETLIFDTDPDFNLAHWSASRGKKNSRTPPPTSDQVLSLFRKQETKPRECLMTGRQLRDAVRQRGWDDSFAPSIRDSLEAQGRLKIYPGAHRSLLAGLPEMVDAYIKELAEHDTLLEQVPLKPTPPRRKRRQSGRAS